jgi:hypothetical protein
MLDVHENKSPWRRLWRRFALTSPPAPAQFGRGMIVDDS